ncbi:hypothetical protein AB0J90_08270 [Micromonospora sp. NPDC049523]|uniref:hypothetical protein n=1 Tax=Micromonospora sp. NPDC049523 TaxID=3155921 RepID=UPI0034127C9D
MSRNFLGKVVAGAALGGASLLVGTPGIASADPSPTATDAGQMSTKPQWAKPGHEVTIVEVCDQPQESPWVWSELTGKLELNPERDRPAAPEEAPPAADLGPVEDYAPEAVESSTTPDDPTNGHADAHDPTKAETPKAEAPKAEESAEAETPTAEDAEADGGSGTGGAQSRSYAYRATAEIPADATPGHYKLKGSCGFGSLVVVPTGWVDGGDGGAGDNGLATSGAAMLGAAVLGGIVLMRRRRIDGSLV